MGFDVRANEIHKFANYLQYQVLEDIRTIDRGLRTEGLNTNGFSGVLEPLVDPLKNGFNDTLIDVFAGLERRLQNMAETLQVACRTYGDIDHEAEADFQAQLRQEQQNEDERLGRRRSGGHTWY